MVDGYNFNMLLVGSGLIIFGILVIVYSAVVSSKLESSV